LCMSVAVCISDGQMDADGRSNTSLRFREQKAWRYCHGLGAVKVEYLDVTVVRRGVEEVWVVAGEAPAC
jgi:hypothetical protein